MNVLNYFGIFENVLNYFGIYEDEINRVDEICQIVLDKSGMRNRYNDMIDDVLDYFYNIQLDCETNITNGLIACMFNSTKNILMEKYKNIEVDYYVNGYDSWLYVNNMDAEDFEFDELENGEEE